MTLLVISLILLCSAVAIATYANQNNSHDRAAYFLSGITALLSTAYIIADRFTGNGIDESIAYHLLHGVNGAGFLEYKLEILIATIGLSASLLFIALSCRSGKLHKPIQIHYKSPVALLLATASLAASPSIYDIAKNYDLIYSFTYVNHAREFIRDYSGTDSPDITISGYKRPATISIPNKKNIIYIYLESLERTYLNESIFPGLTPYLKKLEQESISFTNIDQTWGTGWTIAGMTASQCGIPLVGRNGSGNDKGGLPLFLPRATCLSDILSNNGYHLTFMGGADLQFAGKGNFYKTHGFTEVLGRNELINLIGNPHYRTAWGLYDDSLLDLAREKITELANAQHPFALFLLTLDTHHPHGHPSKSCDGIKYEDGNNRLLNSVACTDYLIGTFVNEIRNNKDLQDTIIILQSDHLAMNGDATQRLETGDRKNLFMILNSGSATPKVIPDAGTTIDTFATVLNILDDTSNDHVGFGINLIDSGNSRHNPAMALNDLFNKNADALNLFWDYPNIPETVKIISSQETALIDEMPISIPALITGHDTITDIYFAKYLNQDLKSTARTISTTEDYLWIDHCEVILGSTAMAYVAKYCIQVHQHDTNTTNTRAVTPNKTHNLHNLFNTQNLPIIAHAGGGIDHNTYTNSIEALNNNYDKGFRLFELDFSWTRDKQLVCIHDWKDHAETVFGFKPDIIPSREEFVNLVKTHSNYKNCTLDSLTEWLADHPDARIVTDIKEDNIPGLEYICSLDENCNRHFIPQIYHPNQYESAKLLGFDDIILTLYRIPKREFLNKSFLRTVSSLDLFAITMHHLIVPLLARKLKISANHRIYAHTVNDESRLSRLLLIGADNIYTDFISPE